MRQFWKSDPCYEKDHGVNGTICSFIVYLSEVSGACTVHIPTDAWYVIFDIYLYIYSTTTSSKQAIQLNILQIDFSITVDLSIKI